MRKRLLDYIGSEALKVRIATFHSFAFEYIQKHYSYLDFESEPELLDEVGALAAVAHDVIFVLGIYSLLYKYMPFHMEIDQHFIAAILTVIGYSMNDTVIVFDRVREYLLSFHEI
jgi:hypothetical protein